MVGLVELYPRVEDRKNLGFCLVVLSISMLC